MQLASAQLPEDVELALLGWGQSNSTPNGSLTDAAAYAAEMLPPTSGRDIDASTNAGSPPADSETVTLAGSAATMVHSEWVGAEYRVGSPTSPAVGYGVVTANTTTALTVAWTKKPADGASHDGYVCFRDHRRSKLGNVRVLTPYLPEAGGAYPSGAVVAPGLDVAASITSYEQLAAFLPLSFKEGIAGYGVSATSGGGDATAATSNSFDFTTAVTASVFAGGYVVVWHSGGVSWSTIADNSANSFTGLFWSGDGTPSGTAADWDWEAWLPHYDNSPAELIPGPGFRYPNNEHEPQGPTRNRARGRTSRAYGDRFGVLVSLAWQLSVSLGRRINVVWLGIDGASLYERMQFVGYGVLSWAGQVGWYSSATRLDFNPRSGSDGLAARLRSLAVVMAPAALQAEGNTKPLRYLGIFGAQGETEAGNANMRGHYENLLPRFYQWLRRELFTAGLSLYSTEERMPVVHPTLLEIWQTDVPALSYYGDTDREVETAILDYAARAPFTASFDPLESAGEEAEVIHFDAEGEAYNGRAAAAALLSEINDAWAAEDDLDDPEVVKMCNLALGHLGESGDIVSLDPEVDESLAAAKCRAVFPQARLECLAARNWTLVSQRIDLAAVTGARTNEWAFAYGMPNNCVRVFSVLPPDAGGDVVASSSSEIAYVSTLENAPRRVISPAVGEYLPQDFRVERDETGYLVLRTNVENAVARYTALVADASKYPPALRAAISWTIAEKLTGDFIKGAEGMKVADGCRRMARLYIGDAAESDQQQQTVHTPPQVSWIAGRG